MLTSRENYLKAARCEKPEWVPMLREANLIPSFIWDYDPTTKRDWLNITWMEDATGLLPMPDTSKPAMTSIFEWRDIVKWPDLDAIDWDRKVEEFFGGETFNSDGPIICKGGSSSLFLIPINMMGWVDGMVDMVEEPQEYRAFVDALTDFICDYFVHIGKYFHPDIVISGDDVASGTGPFIAENVFDEMFYDGFKRICDSIHSIGALAEFHCCGDCQWVIDKEVQLGYDICQLPMPNADLMDRMKKYKGRLAMTGGWDRKGEASKAGAPEEVVRASVHKAIDDWGADGGLIFWDGGVIPTDDDNRRKLEWINDEAVKYGHEVYRI